MDYLTWLNEILFYVGEPTGYMPFKFGPCCSWTDNLGKRIGQAIVPDSIAVVMVPRTVKQSAESSVG